MMAANKKGLPLFPFLMLIVLFSIAASQPQGKKKIEILNADQFTYDQRIIANAERLVGNVIFRHNNVLMYCDSAYNYRDTNMVDAYGNVHIVQGDTLNLYGDKIRYDAGSKVAHVWGNVKLVDKSITLTTDQLIFDLKENVGNYTTGGKIVDTANVLTSVIGRYYSNQDLFLFKDSVKVTNKDFVLTADTLQYNSKMERVIIVAPTHIVGTNQKGRLYSESGWYDTRTNIAELYKGSKIFNKEQFLQGDLLFYSRNGGRGIVRRNVLLSDSTNNIRVTGQYGEFDERTRTAFVTDSALFMQISSTDTLFMHADTLRSVPDKGQAQLKVKGKTGSGTTNLKPKTEKKPAPPAALSETKKDSLLNRISQLPDSLPTGVNDTLRTPIARTEAVLPQDSTKLATGQTAASDTLSGKEDQEKKDNKLFMAYHNVRIYKKDLQGACDSLLYQMKDSMMMLFKDPILWSGQHQLTADQILFNPKEPDPDMAYLENNAFIISQDDSIKYNQISGKQIVGHIYFNKLRFIEVKGNARTIYYLKNGNKYSGMNSLESSKIHAYMLNSQIDSIIFFPKADGKSIPLQDITKENSQLKGFIWRGSERPLSRFDLYPIDNRRKSVALPPKEEEEPKSAPKSRKEMIE